MLTLRNEQMAAFSEQRIRCLEKKVVRFLIDQFPDARNCTEDLSQNTRQQINSAMSYGLFTEREIAFYVTTAWIMGTDFDEHFQIAREILEGRINPIRKCDMLGKWIVVSLLSSGGN